MDTGVVEFTISSDNFEEAAGVAFDLDNDQYQQAIVDSIESSIPSIVVEEYEVDTEVTANIEFTVDADDASNDLTQAAWQSEQLLSDFDVEVQSNSCINFEKIYYF